MGESLEKDLVQSPGKPEKVAVVGFLLRGLLGTLFVAAALSKIQFPLEFLSEVYGYGVLGSDTGILLSLLLPWLELLLGMCLILDILVFESLFLAAGLLALFLIAQGTALASGRVISCGCFGGRGVEDHIGWYTVGRTLILFLLCCSLILLRRREESNNSENS
ncbi:MAG: hypothetical protein NTZ09_00850 [Candidatus Hydrogenedentes bacterium]|nr:hypothetical protein [Candidatus Hydrogenedentota bacterium]